MVCARACVCVHAHEKTCPNLTLTLLCHFHRQLLGHFKFHFVVMVTGDTEDIWYIGGSET